MDEATKRERAKNKLQTRRHPVTGLPHFEARGLGRKAKRHETFPTQICSHWDKKEIHPAHRGPDDKPLFQRKRCTKVAQVTQDVMGRFGKTRRAFCLEHSLLYKAS